MSDLAIRAEGLSKQYRIGVREQQRETLVGAMGAWLIKPFANLRRLRSLQRFEEAEEESVLWALDDVSFDIRRGEVVGIIGRNGAGKTTLLKILSGITAPSRGRAVVNGRMASLISVGTGFHNELTGRENVYLNGTILGMSREEVDKKFDEIIDFSGVERFIDTPVKWYSSGMQVRLAFSVAAHLEPEILLIDEVLAVGDLAFQEKCLKKMQSVVEAGRTVLFISHNMRLVENFCARTLLLQNGCLVADSDTDEVLQQYYATLWEDEEAAEPVIEDNANRRGTGEARITNVTVRDTEGQARYEYRPGETICFELSFEVFSAIEGLDVAVQIRSTGTREALTGVRHSITEGTLAAGYRETVTIELPNVRFRPGTYPLYFGLGTDNKMFVNFGGRKPYDILDDMTPPLIIKAEREGEHGLPGFIDVESKLHRSVHLAVQHYE